MGEGRNHKAFVRCTDAQWREFRALLVQQGKTVQDGLGELVVRSVAKAKRDRTQAEKRRARASREVAKELRAIARGEGNPPKEA